MPQESTVLTRYQKIKKLTQLIFEEKKDTVFLENYIQNNFTYNEQLPIKEMLVKGAEDPILSGIELIRTSLSRADKEGGNEIINTATLLIQELKKQIAKKNNSLPFLAPKPISPHPKEQPSDTSSAPPPEITQEDLVRLSEKPEVTAESEELFTEEEAAKRLLELKKTFPGGEFKIQQPKLNSTPPSLTVKEQIAEKINDLERKRTKGNSK